MIHYDLRCVDGHEFDGWFRDSAGFDEQVSRGLVACPACGETRVLRAMMAPRLGRKGGPSPSPSVATPRLAPPPAGMPDGIRAKLIALRAEVERRCVYVGPDFAAEARAIHEGTADARPIYGEATAQEAEDLREDGVPVSSIPWVRADS